MWPLPWTSAYMFNIAHCAEDGVAKDPFADVAAAESLGYDLPYAWQPDFWALFSVAVLCALVCLWYLGQMWSVNFKAAMTARNANGLEDAVLVKCIPRAHRGKAAMVPLEARNTPVCVWGGRVVNGSVSSCAL